MPSIACAEHRHQTMHRRSCERLLLLPVLWIPEAVSFSSASIQTIVYVCWNMLEDLIIQGVLGDKEVDRYWEFLKVKAANWSQVAVEMRCILYMIYVIYEYKD